MDQVVFLHRPLVPWSLCQQVSSILVSLSISQPCLCRQVHKWLNYWTFLGHGGIHGHSIGLVIFSPSTAGFFVSSVGGTTLYYLIKIIITKSVSQAVGRLLHWMFAWFGWMCLLATLTKLFWILSTTWGPLGQGPRTESTRMRVTGSNLDTGKVSFCFSCVLHFEITASWDLGTIRLRKQHCSRVKS